jgi:hypothetical protein
MGMFDRIKIHQKWLPEDLFQQTDYWQCKDFDCLLETYNIDEDGYITKESNWGEKGNIYKIIYEGYFSFYSYDHHDRYRQFTASVKEGKVVEIREVTEAYEKNKVVQEIWQTEFNYFPTKRLPALMLGFEIKDMEDSERLSSMNSKDKYSFEKFFYTVGFRNTKFFYALQIPIKKDILPIVSQMLEEVLQTQTLAHVTFNDFVQYKKKIKKQLGVDCNLLFRDFDARIFPIDPEKKYIKTLSSIKLPKDFDNFFAAYSPVMLFDWKLFILF